MAEYSKVYKKFWTNIRIRSLSDDARLLKLYVLSNPHSNTLGYYVLPKSYVAEDLGWSVERLGEPFAELLREGLIDYDEASRTILIPSWFEHNKIDNGNQLKKAQAELSELPDSRLMRAFTQALELLPEGFHKELGEGLAKRYGNPEAVSEAVSEAVTETETPPSAGAAEFEEFWEAYPKKAAKKEAEKAWRKLRPTISLAAQIIKAVIAAKATDQWRRDYAPNPATYLNGERWKDEIRPTTGSSSVDRALEIAATIEAEEVTS